VLTAEPTRTAAPPALGRAAVVCAAVSLASLVLPATLAYDPWAWLVWGREVAHGALDTTGGPSWKPLPVIVTTLLAPLGTQLAPLAWTALARFAGLLALVATHRLVRRLGAPAWTAGVAAALVVLTPDGGPRFLRLVAEAHSEPATAALAVLAVERAVAGRPAATFGLLGAVSLMRPEAWPFLLAAAVWVWVQDPARRALVVAGLVAVPVLWFGGDWWGSGSPLHGADAAQVVADEPLLDRLRLALERAWRSVSLPVWPAAAVALVAAARARDRAVLAVGGLAAAWMAVVVGMAALLGYAALSRFYLPSAALLCALAVLAVPALAAALQRVRSRATRRVALAALLLACLPSLLARATALPGLLAETGDRDRMAVALEGALDAAGGARALRGCGALALDPTGEAGPMRPALAWLVDLPLHEVARPGAPGVDTTLARADGRADGALAETGAVLLARNTEWAVWSTACIDPSIGS
jgi:hypothetical protein